MKKIGFHGGHTIYVLGSASDMKLFFDCIIAYPAFDNKDMDWSLLTDRLYKRYLKFDELDQALALMHRVNEAFKQIPSNAVEWDRNIVGNAEKTLLNHELSTLADVFSKFFDSFYRAVSSAKSFYNTFKIYQPVKIIPTDTIYLMMEEKRPLKEYDELDGKPFWLR